MQHQPIVLGSDWHTRAHLLHPACNKITDPFQGSLTHRRALPPRHLANHGHSTNAGSFDLMKGTLFTFRCQPSKVPEEKGKDQSFQMNACSVNVLSCSQYTWEVALPVPILQLSKPRLWPVEAHFCQLDGAEMHLPSCLSHAKLNVACSELVCLF